MFRDCTSVQQKSNRLCGRLEQAKMCVNMAATLAGALNFFVILLTQVQVVYTSLEHTVFGTVVFLFFSIKPCGTKS